VVRRSPLHALFVMEDIIINFVRDSPWLYDASRNDFRDAEKKQNSWQKLADKLNIGGKFYLFCFFN
jgi:hypothetical protein